MTGKYRRRPVEVEAWQFDDAGPAMPYWLEQISKRVHGEIRIDIGAEKPLLAKLGDYVVLHRAGHVSVMDAGTFGVEFEAVSPCAEASGESHG